MFHLFKSSARPPYFYHFDYQPERDDLAYSQANRVSEYVPSTLAWTFDQMEYYVAHKASCTEARKAKAKHFLKMLRIYSATIEGVDPYSTLVTQLYISEMLLSVLLLAFDKDVPHSHGYSFNLGENFVVRSAALRTQKSGIAFAVHELFYDAQLPQDRRMAELEEYFSFLPEIRKEYTSQPRFTRTIRYTSDYGCTGAHAEEGIYHASSVSKDQNDVQGWCPGAPTNEALFPDFFANYTVAGKYMNKCVTTMPKADDCVTVTHDVNGDPYTLGFGTSSVVKQRDIEIRFYIIFVLGSIARYRPTVWAELQERDPEFYMFVRRFVEHNMVLFPLQVLRYMTGCGYYFSPDPKFG